MIFFYIFLWLCRKPWLFKTAVFKTQHHVIFLNENMYHVWVNGCYSFFLHLSLFSLSLTCLPTCFFFFSLSWKYIIYSHALVMGDLINLCYMWMCVLLKCLWIYSRYLTWVCTVVQFMMLIYLTVRWFDPWFLTCAIN